MTPRERVLRTLRFEPVDRVPCDLMEGSIWPELMDYFRETHGLENEDAVLDFLDADFRWLKMARAGDAPGKEKPPAQDPEASTRKVTGGPLAHAETVAEVEAHTWPDPKLLAPPDFADARRRRPDHALGFLPGWMPLFWTACTLFGMDEALIKMITRPAVFEAYLRRQHEYYMDILSRGLAAGEGYCDICWLGDDFASQKAMLMSPDLWRKLIKPFLAEQVRRAREHGMFVLFHSCGAVRSVLGDLIDIGVNALLVFQTTAAGMDAESIARDFGGRLAFYGGIDVQQLLSFGTPEEVETAVRANVRAFRDCGGYVVANCHHRVATIQGRNIEAMFHAARECASN